jgi:hypothetical protein
MPRQTLPKLFLELPAEECTAPRDGLRPCETEDVLFLAALLKRAGSARYFLVLRGGAIVPELVDVDESECSEPVQLKSRISRGTVRRWFRDRFFPFRQEVASGWFSRDGVRFMVKELQNTSRWKLTEPQKLEKKLKWQFQKGPDLLMSHLHEIPLLSWPGPRPLMGGEVYCPVDGPVSPVKMLCGRSSRSLLCPNCLGRFQYDHTLAI